MGIEGLQRVTCIGEHLSARESDRWVHDFRAAWNLTLQIEQDAGEPQMLILVGKGSALHVQIKPAQCLLQWTKIIIKFKSVLFMHATLWQFLTSIW